MVKTPSIAEAMVKARAYCARQERCQQEVRNKLYAWELAGADVEATIAQLIGEGYLNEARFAEHFAVSKFRQKGWGARKIEQALKAKQVSGPCIRTGLKAIAADEVQELLKKHVAKRWEREKESDPYLHRQKVFHYFLRKGFSSEAVEAALADRADQ